MKYWIMIVVLAIGYFLYNGFFDGTMRGWTLMVCSVPHSSGGCYETSYILEGYNSGKECLSEGIKLNNKSGFECGKDCKMTDYGLYVCEEICNEKGCN